MVPVLDPKISGLKGKNLDNMEFNRVLIRDIYYSHNDKIIHKEKSDYFFKELSSCNKVINHYIFVT